MDRWLKYGKLSGMDAPRIQQTGKFKYNAQKCSRLTRFYWFIHSESVDDEVAAASEIDSDMEQKELQHKSLQEDSLHGVKKIAGLCGNQR